MVLIVLSSHPRYNYGWWSDIVIRYLRQLVQSELIRVVVSELATNWRIYIILNFLRKRMQIYQLLKIIVKKPHAYCELGEAITRDRVTQEQKHGSKARQDTSNYVRTKPDASTTLLSEARRSCTHHWTDTMVSKILTRSRTFTYSSSVIYICVGKKIIIHAR